MTEDEIKALAEKFLNSRKPNLVREGNFMDKLEFSSRVLDMASFLEFYLKQQNIEKPKLDLDDEWNKSVVESDKSWREAEQQGGATEAIACTICGGITLHYKECVHRAIELERERREELEMVAAMLYVGSRYGVTEFDQYRAVYLRTGPLCVSKP